MGLQRRKLKGKNQGVRPLIGRLCVQGDGEDRDAFFLVKEGSVRVPLQSVIDNILQFPQMTDEGIVGAVGQKGFRPSDVAVARLYLHRFGPDIANPRMLPSAEERGLLLDENTSPQAVLPLSPVFGWSSHVECEGLAGKKTPDADIWRFAIDSGFRGFVTRDSDFLKVPLFPEFQQAARHSAVPFLVYVKGNLDGDRLVGLLHHHANGIQVMMDSPHQEACEIIVDQNKLCSLTL